MMNFEMIKLKLPPVLVNCRGSVIVLFAITLIVLISMIALAVDVGYILTAKNESQNAADAAALAGARQLGESYHIDPTAPRTNVISVAQNTAAQNKVAGLNLSETVNDNVITQIGTWNWDSTVPIESRFTATTPTTPDYPEAVQVEAKRQGGTTNGPISTFFARIFKLNGPSQDTVDVSATACASLTGPCEGKPTVPIGIAVEWFSAAHGKKEQCSDDIQMNDTNTSCAGWTNLLEGTKEAKWKKEILPYMESPYTPIPTVTAGKTYEFTGGQLPELYAGMKTLFEDPTFDTANKTIVGGVVTSWTTAVIVYEANCGDNPHQGMKMLGFTKIVITGVQVTNPKTIFAHVACGMTTSDPGGCKPFGYYSYKSPHLVR
jgi:Flp pilus assembly protein TadG